MQSNTDWDSVTYLRKAKTKPGAAKSSQVCKYEMQFAGIHEINLIFYRQSMLR